MAYTYKGRSEVGLPPCISHQPNATNADFESHFVDRAGTEVCTTSTGHQARLRLRRYSPSRRFLSTAAQHPFVMHAVLAFSANHLAWVSQSSETRNLAFNYGAVAMKGLHEAIGTFSRANSDAILAASLLLSWQSTEWLVFRTCASCLQIY